MAAAEKPRNWLVDLGQRRPLAAVLAVAAIYFAVGQLSLQMAIPPGYAAAIWPSAGVALVAVLHLGWRGGVGAALGSMAVAATMGGGQAAPSLPLVSGIVLVVAVSLAAWLQAALGAWLIGRFGDARLELVRERDIAATLLLGGPVSCLVAATVGTCALSAAGLTAPSDFAFSWFTWWVGDSIGVVIVLPLAQIAIGRDSDLWRKRRTTIAAPLLVGTAMVAILFVEVSEWESTRVAGEFSRRAGVLTHAIRDRFNESTDVARAVVALFRTHAPVTAEDFATFCGGFLQGHPEVQGMSFARRVAAAERPAYEADMRRQGRKEFAIVEAVGQEGLMAAGQRPWYAPVTYIEPLSSNWRAFGFDLASEPSRLATLEAARDLDAVVATPPIQLVQVTDDRLGFLLLAPVYERGAAPTTVDERRAKLRGFASVVFLTHKVIATKLRPLNTSNLTICVYDDSAKPAALLFPNLGGNFADCNDSAAVPFAVTDRFTAAGRNWRVYVRPTAEFVSAQRNWQPWMVMAAGLLFVAMFGALLLTLTGREARLTEALAAAERLQSNLQATELRADAIVRALPDIVFRQDRQGTYLGYSAPETDELYVPPEVFIGKNSRQVLPPALADRVERATAQVLATGRLQHLEYQLETGGQLRDYEARITATADGQVVTLVRNITAAKNNERALRRSLAEKEVLLKEVHHRVKNNLQVISSLLNLQSMHLQDPAAEQLLAESQRRVLSIALVHEKLYQSQDLASIDFKEYVQVVVDALTHAHDAAARGIAVSVQADGVRLGVDLAIPCGLIVHELVSNALQHAFVGRPGGQIAVRLVRGDADMGRLQVSDDGIGLPTGEEARKTRSLGLDLVDAFLAQLGGTMTVSRHAGTEYCIEFALPKATEIA